ncbi:MAG TPA: hypothetical protein DEB30_02120 [Candidatus Peribacter riflensis]|nr:MAG: hypothetical protein A2412_03285 [Candidatus Peribacteria bacterium RIFOXYC1_FULL_58_8]HBH19496.1 hypothetical protein [Candidatus Peribacter riflensis]HBU09576.1 hypothetical protein [Candidatus Peribacter riflensis]
MNSLPTKNEALKLLGTKRSMTPTIPVTLFSQLEDRRMTAMLLAQEKQDIIAMRKKWSGWILLCIVLIVIYDMVMIPLIGVGVFAPQDEGAKWLIGLLITENLAKVLGLAYIVVNWLFSGDSVGLLPEKHED